MKELPISIKDSVLPWIGKTGKMLHVFINEKFKENNLDITMEQFITLRMLYMKDGQPQHNLAKFSDRHKASVTRLLSSMERKLLIARIQNPDDKRINLIYLTTSGRKMYYPAKEVIKNSISEVQQSLSPTEIQSLIVILKKIQKNLIIR